MWIHKKKCCFYAHVASVARAKIYEKLKIWGKDKLEVRNW